MDLSIRSSAFAAQGAIPARFTCEGDDASPPLAWQGAPEGTKSFALIVDDPDAPDPAAPTRVWVHWLLYNLPSSSTGLTEDVGDALPTGTRVGRNDWGRQSWGGPCPPIGRHRYFFKLFALDTLLADLDGPDRAALERAMDGHVLARAELIGTYQKKG
jgi:Raf kinase inhibitor-like YbhB/YbcL family protein